MEFDNSLPIYQQIADLIKAQIVSGELSSGSKIRPVRDLAVEMGVNPNTMQKALSALELDGLVYSERTSGRYVTKEVHMIEKLKREMLLFEIKRFLEKTTAMGYDNDRVLEELREYRKNEGREINE